MDSQLRCDELYFPAEKGGEVTSWQREDLTFDV